MTKNDKKINLKKVILRQLTDPVEKLRWDSLVKEQHYLKSSAMVGQQIRYVAEYNGVWMACLGCSAASFKSVLRSNWIEWSPIQEKQRLHLVVQNARFLILKDISIPNLASRCLALLGKRISADWKATYGHPVYLLETFVDETRSATCYKACGWVELGFTKGFRRAIGGYERHGIKKRYLVFPVQKKAQELLSSEKIVDDKSLEALKVSELPLFEQKAGFNIHDILDDFFPRTSINKPKTNGFHVNVTIALVLAGFVCGIKDSENIAAWAKELSDKYRRALGCPYRIRKNISGYQVPCANTIRYALQDIDSTKLEKAMTKWANVCGINTENTVLALDGKVLRGANTEDERAPNHVTLYDVKTGTVLDQDLVPNKTSEVTTARKIFERNNIEGTLVTADAAHTNVETANLILKKKPISYSQSKKINLSFSMP